MIKPPLKNFTKVLQNGFLSSIKKMISKELNELLQVNKAVEELKTKPQYIKNYAITGEF